MGVSLGHHGSRRTIAEDRGNAFIFLIKNPTPNSLATVRSSWTPVCSICACVCMHLCVCMCEHMCMYMGYVCVCLCVLHIWGFTCFPGWACKWVLTAERVGISFDLCWSKVSCWTQSSLNSLVSASWGLRAEKPPNLLPFYVSSEIQTPVPMVAQQMLDPLSHSAKPWPPVLLRVSRKPLLVFIFSVQNTRCVTKTWWEGVGGKAAGHAPGGF